ncbi:hypothetical protein Bpfe_014496 [Biomphalaria pfeifferi]|uniref:Uncharacterized protein n=1 Tax=Biomphalaria pfeifferi TaxID=112525 RepID=A0AAD8BK57_BIOPF|nr:hypothetical protein Bpfe_014496 [Biomphalaria pfeifferi]
MSLECVDFKEDLNEWLRWARNGQEKKECENEKAGRKMRGKQATLGNVVEIYGDSLEAIIQVTCVMVMKIKIQAHRSLAEE